MKQIIIGNHKYKISEAVTDEERKKGLLGVKELPNDEGMLFHIDPPKELVTFTMRGCLIPLDIIFINLDQEVIDIYSCNPRNQNIVCKADDGDLILYVLEVNKGSNIEIGDELELEDESEPVMKVLFPDGTELMALWGGERIFSRVHTKILIKKAKKAENSKEDKDYIALGKYMFKCIKTQNDRAPEYVQAPK